jgi:hypothetical protein
MCKAILVAWLTFRVSLPLTAAEPDTHISVTVPVTYEFEVPCWEPPKNELRPVKWEKHL